VAMVADVSKKLAAKEQELANVVKTNADKLKQADQAIAQHKNAAETLDKQCKQMHQHIQKEAQDSAQKFQQANHEIASLKGRFTAAQENAAKQEELLKKLSEELTQSKTIASKGAEEFSKLQVFQVSNSGTKNIKL